MSQNGCSICAKHRGEGPLVGPILHADALVVVSHAPAGPWGHAFVETRRHVTGLDELTEVEAERVGRLTARLARALRLELDVERVHTFVAGLTVDHFHQHVLVRHRGTPAAHPWWQPWDGAPQDEVGALAARLRSHLGC